MSVFSKSSNHLLSLEDKSTCNDGSVHKIDLRKTSATESFTLTRGIGIVFVFFEEVPIWLSALTSMCFRYIYFPSFTSYSALINYNFITKWFVLTFLKDWPRDRIRFKSDMVETPTFVLVSGSKGFLSGFDMIKFEAPLLFTYEANRLVRIQKKSTITKSFYNFKNGGCLAVKTMVGFVNIKPPLQLTSIHRTLGDFIDYGDQPSSQVNINDLHIDKWLTTDSLPLPIDFRKNILLPSFRFASGWGTRPVSRKELFGIWGLSELVSSPIDKDYLMNLNPTQPLSLIINSFLVVNTSSSRPLFKSIITTPPPSTTTFDSLNIEISNEWISQSVVDQPNRKEDKAPTPSELWDKRILLSFPDREGVVELISVFRSFLLRVYRRRLLKSFTSYLRSSFPNKWDDYLLGQRSQAVGGDELSKSIEVGRDVMVKAAKSSWFEWLGGSTLVFWKWHDFRREARDGLPIFFLQKSVKSIKRSQWKVSKGALPSNEDLRPLFIEKLSRLLDTGYVETGFVRWDVHFFSVPKGENDIRLVFNGTSNGLNELVWAPSFFLPTSESLGRLIEVNTFQADLDVGEMFLNFPLTKSARPYSGVNLSNFDLPGVSESDRHRWTRLWFGFRFSPYGAVRSLAIAEELARGDPLETKNPFHWDSVRLNLPCSPDFNPSMPWIFKWNSVELRIAGDCVIFVDDSRLTGFSIENAWQIARRLASIFQSLGIQEAARKRKPPSLDAGPWAGCVVKTNGLAIKMISQEKWLKTKSYLNDLQNKIGSRDHPGPLEVKWLERIRGFLNHIAITYCIILPFLRGFHNTIDSWRDGRDVEGWKSSDVDSGWLDVLNHNLFSGKINQHEFDFLLGSRKASDQPPKYVLPAPRLFDDLEVLQSIFKEELPAKMPIRHSKTAEVYYGFYDASGRGLGSTLQSSDESKLRLRVGVWSASASQERSSNWKELSNLVEGLEEEAKRGKLTNALLFFFTDNSTAETAIAKGNSPSRHLFELVLRIKALQMKYGFELHVIHVAGTRMIEQGTDGLSRGAVKVQGLNKKTLKEYAPLNLNALERCDVLLSWVKSWIGSHFLLSPKHWFVEAHDLRFTPARNIYTESATYLWIPPPCITDVALEQLRYARLKRQLSTHVMVVPKLFFGLWRRQLFKCMDMILFLPPGFHCWPSNMHEPLILAFAFPFSRFEPWCIKNTPKVCALARKMQALWKAKEVDGSDNLRKFLLEVKRLPTMPEHVVRQLLFFES